MKFKMLLKQFFILFLLFTTLTGKAQLNMSFVSSVAYDSVLVSDVWGYVAPDGTEYAIVGNFDGVSIVNLADPANPVESAYLEGAGSRWRDIKTWGEYAYVTNETGDGLMVIDLTDLPNGATSYNWTPDLPSIGGVLNSCHNIYIDELGYAYLTGCNLNQGGLIYVDVFTEPGSPIYVDAGFPIYSHDVYVRDNIAYSSEINQGNLSIYDVSDKSATDILGQTQTPFSATHNAWISDDGKHIFTTDELADAPITSYNIEDFTDIKELDQYRPAETLGTGVAPHNVHVWQDWIIASHYSDGCIIIDATHPDNLIEVGNFDTYFAGATGFNGAWGAYPYLPSGLILVSDKDAGLFVLEPTYVKACYLEGNITDATTGNTIPSAEIRLLNTFVQEESNTMGVYKTGVATADTYEVEVSHPFYESQIAEAVLENGQITVLDFELTPLPTFTVNGSVNELAGESLPFSRVKFIGEVINTEIETDENGNFSLPNFLEGAYTIYAGKWGYKQMLSLIHI